MEEDKKEVKPRKRIDTPISDWLEKQISEKDWQEIMKEPPIIPPGSYGRIRPRPIRQRGGDISVELSRNLYLPPKFDMSEVEKKWFKDIITKPKGLSVHNIFPTINPDPHSWINQFLNDEEMKPEAKNRIIFKFGEFIGRVCKEENTSYNEVVKVLLEFVEQNIKKK